MKSSFLPTGVHIVVLLPCYGSLEGRNSLNCEFQLWKSTRLSCFREETFSVLARDAFERPPSNLSTEHFSGFLLVRFHRGVHMSVQYSRQ